MSTNSEFSSSTIRHALHELGRALTSPGTFDDMLRRIAEETTKVFGASFCIIRLIEDGMLRVRASQGIPKELEPVLSLSIGEGVAGRAVQENRTIIMHRQEDIDAVSHLAQHLPIRTALCAPLSIGNDTIGAFGLYDKKGPDGSVMPFSEDSVDLFEIFASLAAVVIDKSVLYEKAHHQEQEANAAKQKIEELKEYYEGLIRNSADAIVTSDLDGVVTSWNEGAERMYGFSRDEAVGNFLPFLPHFLVDNEKEHINSVRKGQTLKSIETVRKTKDGRIIDINLTLSPIKNVHGDVIGVSGIARDVTEKKRTEKDLLLKNNELSRLLIISSSMRGTLELEKLLRMVLTAVTIGDGLGFNRAMLFLVDRDQQLLKGAMGVGPSSHEEAWEIWSKISIEQKNLDAMIEEITNDAFTRGSLLDRICGSMEVRIGDDSVLARALREKTPINVAGARPGDPADDALLRQLGTSAYAVVPLISRGKAIGVLWVDNQYSRRPITDHDLQFLMGFTDQMASAIENARLFEYIAEAEQELENIFESISDLVFFNDADYQIKKVNRAVLEKMGKPAEEIVGKKCYEIFHGTQQPLKRCPHHKTIATHKSYIEELDEPHMEGTFLFSSSPIFSKTGDLIGTVHVARDISELEKLRHRVVSAERMAALGEMAAKVAHEIRNPLMSIGGFARRLEKRLDGDLRDNARIIVDEVRRLEAILTNTLAFVKSERVEKHDVSAEEIVKNVVNLLEPSLHEKGNTLVKEVDPFLIVSVDINRFRQALLNIVTNANNATRNGSIMLTARAASASHGADAAEAAPMDPHEAVFEVRDTGTGIREKDLSRIFDPFYTTRPTGTGLGLSITKKIIEEMDGRIEVESIPGTGTTFRIYLPPKEVRK